MLLAGIDEKVKIPAGQAIMEEGRLTGVFREAMADKFREMIPDPSEDEMTQLLERAQANCFAAGLTSVTDAGIENRDVDRIVSLQQKGYLKMRIDTWLRPTKENIGTFVLTGVIKTPYIHIHAIKLYADGALGSRGAWLLKPYSDEPDGSGISTLDTVEMERICSIALRHGYQVCTHAIGDAANRMVLHIYAKMLCGTNDRRWRIEHAQVIDPQDMSLFGRFSIIPSVQATHATSDMDWAGERLGDRIKNAYPYKRLLAQNGWMPNGTDFPIEEIYPTYTLYAATARKAKDGHPVKGFQMQDGLTRLEALRSMTIWAARASFEEAEKGTIEKGKYADFVIWNTDLMNCKEADIITAKPVKTYSGGQIVFETGK
jgi:predicted amidohydrolase YtcJ